MSDPRLLSEKQLQDIADYFDKHSARLYGVPRLLTHIDALTERCEKLELQVETEKAGPLMEQLAFLRQQLAQSEGQR